MFKSTEFLTADMYQIKKLEEMWDAFLHHIISLMQAFANLLLKLFSGMVSR
jgi:hypothetical protein